MKLDLPKFTLWICKSRLIQRLVGFLDQGTHVHFDLLIIFFAIECYPLSKSQVIKDVTLEIPGSLI